MVGGQNRIMAKVIILLLFGACKCLCGGERERENKNPCSDTQFKFQLSILFYFISLFSVFLFSFSPPFSPPVLVVANRFPFVELFSHILHQLWVRSVPSTTLFIYLFAVGLFLLVGPFLWRAGGGRRKDFEDEKCGAMPF
jgi:hypothetical protein